MAFKNSPLESETLLYQQNRAPKIFSNLTILPSEIPKPITLIHGKTIAYAIK